MECGLDETGYGSCAGPVFCAAVIWPNNLLLSSNYEKKLYLLVKDSKQLSPRQRDIVFDFITKHATAYSIQSASVQEINDTNVLIARDLAMHRCIEELNSKMAIGKLLIDGNRFNNKTKIPHECIIKGDQKKISISAASILAKVTRDRVMIELHKSFPQYGWAGNKGYVTQNHKKAIEQFGKTIHHRNYNLKPCKP